MSVPRLRLESAVQAYRTHTDASSDGRATRARVLATLSIKKQRRITVRARAGLLLAILAGSSAAWASRGAIWAWRRNTAAQVPATGRRSLPAGLADVAEAPLPAKPPAPQPGWAPAAPASPPSVRDAAEQMAYARAHSWHFRRQDWRRALRAWSVYLHDFPDGAFEPEAAFNRAVCLVRLGRRTVALHALEPFLAGRYGARRRADARRLASWLVEQEGRL